MPTICLDVQPDLDDEMGCESMECVYKICPSYLSDMYAWLLSAYCYSTKLFLSPINLDNTLHDNAPLPHETAIIKSERSCDYD